MSVLGLKDALIVQRGRIQVLITRQVVSRAQQVKLRQALLPSARDRTVQLDTLYRVSNQKCILFPCPRV